jgi:DNA-binding CsgD family transcriptional regulator
LCAISSTNPIVFDHQHGPALNHLVQQSGVLIQVISEEDGARDFFDPIPGLGVPAKRQGAENRAATRTSREAEVLLWLSRGKSNRDIAAILGLSPRTVNKHLEQMFEKLGVENRASATALAVRILQGP